MADVIVSGEPVDKDTDPVEETKAYVLREGKTHTEILPSGRSRSLKGGDTAQLTKSAFKAFKDKFIDPSAEAEKQDRQRRAQADAQSGSGAAPTPGIAQDDSAKNPIAPPTQAPKPVGSAGVATAPRPPMGVTNPADSNKK